VKRIFHYLPLFLLPAFSIPLAHAQYGFDVGVGFGTMQDKASGTASITTTICLVHSRFGRPQLRGHQQPQRVQHGVSGNVMAWKHFGIGGEVNFQPGKQNYLELPSSVGVNFQSRMILYDFDGIYQPVRTKKVAFQVIGGVGGASLRYYETGATAAPSVPRMLPVLWQQQSLSSAWRRGGSVLPDRSCFPAPPVRHPLRSQPDAIRQQPGDVGDPLAGLHLRFAVSKLAPGGLAAGLCA